MKYFYAHLKEILRRAIYIKNRNETVAICLQVPQSELDLDTVKSILSEYRIHNADITLRYDATSDDLIDVIEGNRIYVPCIYLLNKIGQYKTIFNITLQLSNCRFECIPRAILSSFSTYTITPCYSSNFKVYCCSC